MEKKKIKYKEKDNYLLKLNDFYKEVVNGESLLKKDSDKLKIKKDK
jgi:hypothetical protein